MAAKKKISHAERSHALLSASGAARWMNCTPSAKLEEQYGEKKESVYANEGTLAHELSELYLRRDVLSNISDEDFEQQLSAIMSNELFSEEMLDVTPIYTDYCTEQYVSAQANNSFAEAKIEQRLDLTKYIPDAFGTADCVIISDGVMEVIDLKYGKGVRVDAEWNKQLMVYGLGALHKYDTMYDIEQVKLTVVQPRIDNISSWQISAEELYKWAKEELAPTAEKAYAGEGELNVGEWCRFCSVKNRCRKLCEVNSEVAKYDFAEPALLTDDEVADVLGRVPNLVEWANSVAEYAKDKAVNEGKRWPGYKLVEGVSRRQWVEEEKVVRAITERFPGTSDEDLYDMKLKTITAMEKLLGKKEFEKLSDVVVKPQGKPTLVPVSDKRPAIGYDQALEDFK